MRTNVQEKILSGHKIGGLVLFLVIALYILAIPGVAFGAASGMGIISVISVIWLCGGWILLCGLKVLKPNEALVLTLFGKYVGTLKGDGFFWVNPFCTAFNPASGTKLGQSGDVAMNNSIVSLTTAGTAANAEAYNKKISLKVMTLSNSRQKVNDVLGNPVEVAVAVMWRVVDTAKAVILAVGASNRHMGIAREDELLGKGISYCATCDGAFYKGKTVAVTGGGNTAVEDAIYLAGIVDKVYLIHRRNEFRAEDVLVDAAKKLPNLEIVTPYVVESLLGEPKLTGVELTNREDGSKKTIDVNGLFVAIGQEPKTADFKDLVTLQGGYIEAGENCKTNVEGIFAAGDARVKKVRQLTTACADGAVAALAAIDYIKLGV